MWELRFPTLEEYHEEGDTFFSEWFADLKETLLVYKTMDWDGDSVRLHHLRRLDGPIWQLKEEYESWERRLAELEREEATGFTHMLEGEDELEKLRVGPKWLAIENESLAPTLEVAYQRFTRQYQDTFWPKSRVDLSMDGLRRRDRSLLERQRESSGHKSRDSRRRQENANG
jgi:hypothetical protein